ncbi:MAG: amidase family protein [Gammaproteobacteria bacterium]|nr:amidase [Pseudomonadales bacterium]MCP5349061.1 amidase [Pseudomonadales bacterium]
MKAIIYLTVLCSLSSLLHAQSDFEVTEAGIPELQSALASGRVTSVELVQKYLARIAAYDHQGPGLNSLVRINPDAAEIAARLDTERRLSGPRGPLHGIPVIIKDNYNTVTVPTTGSSVALAGFTPTANATQVQRLIDAGAIILAKSNLHEYAYGITSIGSLAGQTRNPYDPRRVPGGSSGGTGAAVAASLGAVGMGSDTCGSIRVPAAFNNLAGLRPSKGLSSIYGVMPLSHTQDVAGPLARSVTDLAIVLDAVAGYDPRDVATAYMAGRPAPGFVAKLSSESLAGLRIGRLEDYFGRADNAVNGVITEVLEKLQAAGVEIVDLDTQNLAPLLAGSGLIGHEFKADLNTYLITFGSERISSLDDIVDAGLYHEAVQGALTRSRNSAFNEEAYLEAQLARAQLREQLEDILAANDLDALVYPPIGQLPVFIGESQPGNNCSLSANTGLPAISVPAGFSTNGLPVGLELLGGFMSDARLVSIAYRIEQLITPRRIPIATPPLEAGLAPPPMQAEWHYIESEINLAATLSYDQTRRQLYYDITNTGRNPATLYALTLMIDNPPLGQLNDPQVANLMPPESVNAEGQIFADAELHQAILDGRLHLRLFTADAPGGLFDILNFQPR